MLLALFAATALCWLMLSSLSAKMPWGFSAELLPPVKPQLAPLQGARPSQVQDLALVPVDFHKVPVSTFPQPVWVPLGGSPFLERNNWRWHYARAVNY